MFTGDGEESNNVQALRGIARNDAHRLSVYRVTLIFSSSCIRIFIAH